MVDFLYAFLMRSFLTLARVYNAVLTNQKLDIHQINQPVWVGTALSKRALRTESHFNGTSSIRPLNKNKKSRIKNQQFSVKKSMVFDGVRQNGN